MGWVPMTRVGCISVMTIWVSWVGMMTMAAFGSSMMVISNSSRTARDLLLCDLNLLFSLLDFDIHFDQFLAQHTFLFHVLRNLDLLLQILLVGDELLDDDLVVMQLLHMHEFAVLLLDVCELLLYNDKFLADLLSLDFSLGVFEQVHQVCLLLVQLLYLLRDAYLLDQHLSHLVPLPKRFYLQVHYLLITGVFRGVGELFVVQSDVRFQSVFAFLHRNGEFDSLLL